MKNAIHESAGMKDPKTLGPGSTEVAQQRGVHCLESPLLCRLALRLAPDALERPYQRFLAQIRDGFRGS